MHYKNGREAKVGDPVIGTTYNRKGIQAGTLVSVTPGCDTCNCSVAISESLPLPGFHYNRTGFVQVTPTDKDPMNDLISPVIDHSACNNLVHAEDAFVALIPPKSAP